MATPADLPAQDLATLRRYQRMFDDYRDTFATARAKQQRDQDYYDDRQISLAQRAILEGRKQPAVWTNRIKPAVNGTIGVVARGKTDPRAYPRTPKNEDDADTASDVLRYIYDATRFQRTKLQVLKDILVPGCGAVCIEVDGRNEVAFNQIRWEEFVYDIRSRRDDFKDARYLGIAKWMYADTVKKSYPEHAEAIEGAMVGVGLLGVSGGDTFEDRPMDGSTSIGWIDKKARRILVCEFYVLEDSVWRRVVFCSAAILYNEPSPYLDDYGEPMCAIEAQAGYVDRFNHRMGMVRTMIPIQDSINASRSRAQHFLNMRQVQQVDPMAPPVDANIARTEAAKPDGVIPPGWQVVPTTDILAGNLQMQQEAKGEIERMAPIPSLVGRADSGASGRAQLVQSQAGMTEFAMLFDGFTDWEQRVSRQGWLRARQFWTQEKALRITDNEQGSARFTVVNKVVQPPQPLFDPATGLPAIDPETGQPMMSEPVLENQLSNMDMDIIIDAVPDTANVQQEQWQELMQLLGTNPAYAQQVPFSVALEMSSIINKRDLVKKLKETDEAQQQQQQQEADERAQLGKAAAVADIEKTNSETAKNAATADKTQAEAIHDGLRAKFEMAAAMNPPPGWGGQPGFQQELAR